MEFLIDTVLLTSGRVLVLFRVVGAAVVLVLGLVVEVVVVVGLVVDMTWTNSSSSSRV